MKANSLKNITVLHRMVPSVVRLGVVFAIAALSSFGTAQAQVTGISYSISPSAEYIRLSDASALNGGLSLGGEVGFSFGEYLEVSGLYQYMPGVSTDWANIPAEYLRSDLPDLATRTQALRGIASRDASASRYGGRLRINVGDFRYTPYVTFGSGVFRMKPDGLEASSVIYGTLGVGAAFSVVDRFTVSLGVQNMSYRLNPATSLLSAEDISGLELTPTDFVQQRVRNLGVVASLRLYLAGRSDGSLTDMDRAMLSQFQGGNFRVAIEPSYGQINFNSALGISGSRAVAGVNAGFDLGPYIGVRGFYLRDTDQTKVFSGGVPKKLAKASYYGGELQLRFDQEFGGGMTPYAILGGGFFDNNDQAAYTTDDGSLFGSRYFAIAGGGLEMPLGSAVHVHGAVRGMFMSSQDIAEVAQPSAVYASPMYTVGVSFNIGGSGRTLGRSIDDRFTAEREEADRRQMSTEARLANIEDRQISSEDELKSIQMRIDSVAVTTTMTSSDVWAAKAAIDLLVLNVADQAFADSVRNASEAAAAARTVPANTGSKTTPAVPTQPKDGAVRNRTTDINLPPSDYISDEILRIPAPKEGEIYIRYGRVVETTSDMVAPPIVISSSGKVLDSGQFQGAKQGLSAEDIRIIIQQELAVSSKNNAVTASDTTRVSGAQQELSDELSRLRAEIADLKAKQAASGTAINSGVDSSLIKRAALTDSVLTDLVPVDSVAIDSMAIDSVAIDSLVINPVVIDSVAIDSVSTDSVSIGTLGRPGSVVPIVKVLQNIKPDSVSTTSKVDTIKVSIGTKSIGQATLMPATRINVSQREQDASMRSIAASTKRRRGQTQLTQY